MVNNKIGIIGLGNLAERITTNLNNTNLNVYDIKPDRTRHFAQKFGAHACETLESLIKESRFLFLTVRPENFEHLSRRFSEVPLLADHIIVSMAAGIETEKLSLLFNHDKIYRVMPNSTASKSGYSAIVKPNKCEDDYNEIKKILLEFGCLIELSEDKLPAFTSFSCAGSVMLLKIYEAFLMSGIYFGFSKKDSNKMTVANFKAWIEMFENNSFSIETEIYKLCSPGGVGIEMFREMSDQNILGSILASFTSAEKKEIDLLKGRNS